MPVNWDVTKDRQFLLTIIHVTGTGAPNWNKVAELLNSSASEGDQYIGNAIRQRYAKMKKDAQALYGEMPAMAEGASSTPKTPSKRGGKKAAGETPAKSTGKRKSSKKSDSAEEDSKDNNEEDELVSPSKKVKIEPVVQSEDEDELV